MTRRLKFIRAVCLKVAVGAILAAGGWSTAVAAEVIVNINAAVGLKFDPPRFSVRPGTTVTIAFHNPDEMIHNLVITRPGARMDVVTAALALGADGPAMNFVPPSEKILWSTIALNPGATTTLTFTAPAEPGVYPYVCTFPGHGLVMYGAMYVTSNPELPPLDRDPNIPPPAAADPAVSDHSHAVAGRPIVSRTFLPDCGPAAIAVGLPGGQSYSFDAGACRLRYVWRGGFVDNSAHWLSKGDLWARVVGRIYYRAPEYARIRIGDSEQPPVVAWRGYQLINGYPEFQYTIDGVDVRELVRPKSDGTGIEINYRIPAATTAVHFVADPDGGGAITSSAGAWSNGRLTLIPVEARQFTLIITERPGVEPLGYWSMNDTVFPGRNDPLPGVVGRAFTPGGFAGKRRKLDSGITLAALANGGTLMSWVKLDRNRSTTEAAERKSGSAPIFSAGEGKAAFLVSAPVSDEEWHHVSAVLAKGDIALYFDGKLQSNAPMGSPPSDAPILIGSLGDREFLSGLLDEVRIYDRMLDAGEINRIYRREAPANDRGRRP